ncbi:hypothetical protein [Lysinibacillus fusiformis]|uniref:hypothetical protein n=1 Tax=Lysinibacillus fusiformis TaxID=28031 RepID=UPI00215B2885|nr:hypothetical protein [Lysinibacillus fusiformis]MCR8854908.1 hypothetical protein [Lysinibacillus fusiformis]
MSSSIEHTFYHGNKYQLTLQPGETSQQLQIFPSNDDGLHVIEDIFFEPKENAKAFLLSKILVNEKFWLVTFINIDTKPAVIDISILERKYFEYKPL